MSSHSHLPPSPVTRSPSDEDLDNIMSQSTPSGRQHAENNPDNAVTSIQALIRGNMTQRSSNRFSMLEDHPSNSGEYVDDNMDPVSVHPPTHGNNEFHDPNNINMPLYLQQVPKSGETALRSPHTSTWVEADHLSPLSMDIGGRNSLEMGPLSPAHRRTLSPTKSPPAPGVGIKVKAASLRSWLLHRHLLLSHLFLCCYYHLSCIIA